MGRKILIYENGQTYEIDEEEIYIPKFEKDKKKNNETQNEPERHK